LDFKLQDTGRQWGSKVALAGVDLSLSAGERVAIIGPSGSGKTTLLKLLNGVLRPSTGKVLVDGVDLDTLSPRALRKHRSRCAIVAQGAQLVPQLSVHRNVTAGSLPQWPWYKVLASLVIAFDKKDTAALLKTLGLSERQWERVSVLSGGEQQRVAIARALSGDADVLLADEPTAALDPTNAREVLDLLLAYVQKNERTLVISTHWVSAVRSTVDRLIGVREGSIAFDKPATSVTDADLESLYAGSGERR